MVFYLISMHSIYCSLLAELEEFKLFQISLQHFTCSEFSDSEPVILIRCFPVIHFKIIFVAYHIDFQMFPCIRLVLRSDFRDVKCFNLFGVWQATVY